MILIISFAVLLIGLGCILWGMHNIYSGVGQFGLIVIALDLLFGFLILGMIAPINTKYEIYPIYDKTQLTTGTVVVDTDDGTQHFDNARAVVHFDKIKGIKKTTHYNSYWMEVVNPKPKYELTYE